jgi:hypothetical protein
MCLIDRSRRGSDSIGVFGVCASDESRICKNRAAKSIYHTIAKNKRIAKVIKEQVAI